MMPSDPYVFENLWRAYRACRRTKRATINALRFEIDAEANLLQLQRELRDHTYRPGRSICFVTGGPKPREVFAADFRDRVVHHLLVARLERVFEPMFIHDSYACRLGKGTLAASDRLMEFLRRATANGRRPAWAIHLDVASFFPSIHKRTLFALIARRVRHPELRWLTHAILFHDPTVDYHFQSRGKPSAAPGGRGYPVPAAKSLFGKANERGLPIGNLTSQFWANVYLNEVDQFVKRTLRCRHYVRYVDDMVLLAERPEQLREWRDAIATCLRERLRLRLRPELSEPFAVSAGIDFVGWKTWWSHRVPRRQTLSNLGKRLRQFERAAVRPALNGSAQRIELQSADGVASVARLRAVVASYAGHFRHGATARLWGESWARHRWLAALFVRDRFDVHTRWPTRPVVASRFRDQYRQLIRYAGSQCLVFCRVGRFVEFYGSQRVIAQRVLGLPCARRGRAGYALVVGFLTAQESRYLARAIDSGLAAVEIRQTHRSPLGVGCRTRLVGCVIVPGRNDERASRR